MSSPKYRLGYPDASLSLPARAGADGSGPDGRHDNADLGGFAGTDGRPPESIPDEPPEHKPGSNAGHGHSASTARYADGIEHSRRVGSPVASSPPIRRRPRLSAILQAQLMLRFGAEPGAFSTSLSRALAVSGRPALSEQSPHCKALHRLTHLFRPQTRRRDHAPGPPFRRDDVALPEEGLAFPRSRSPQLTPSRKLRSQPTGCAFSQPSTHGAADGAAVLPDGSQALSGVPPPPDSVAHGAADGAAVLPDGSQAWAGVPPPPDSVAHGAADGAAVLPDGSQAWAGVPPPPDSVAHGAADSAAVLPEGSQDWAGVPPPQDSVAHGAADSAAVLRDGSQDWAGGGCSPPQDAGPHGAADGAAGYTLALATDRSTRGG